MHIYTHIYIFTGKGVAPSPTPWCSKLSKREPSGTPSTMVANFTYLLYIFIYIMHIYTHIYIYI